MKFPKFILRRVAIELVFRSLRGHQRDRAFMGVEREIRRLQALQAAMVTEVSSSLSFVDDAHLSANSWVQAVINSSKSTALRLTHVARLLSSLPLLDAAVQSGQVGPDQRQLFVRLHMNPRCGHLLASSGQLLLGFAKSLRLHEFRQVCQRWEAHNDPDGAHRDHGLARENRSVRCISHGAGHDPQLLRLDKSRSRPGWRSWRPRLLRTTVALSDPLRSTR